MSCVESYGYNYQNKDNKMNILESILRLEDNVTEILKNLCFYKLFRENFMEFLEIKEEIIFDNIYTQIPLNIKNINYGIADIYIETEESIYIVEVKTNIYTNLSKHQKMGDYQKYLDNFNKLKNKKVIYLVPKQYKDNIESKNIKYWEDFITMIKLLELDKLNPYIKDFIDFFNKHLMIENIYKFNNNEINLIKGEKVNYTNVSIPELMEKLFNIVEEVKDKVNYINTKTNTEQNPNWYGYYLSHKFKGIDGIWFGIDFELWKNTKNPFSIQIIAKNEILNTLNLDEFIKEDEYMYYIPKFDNNKFDVKNFVAQIEKVLEDLKQ